MNLRKIIERLFLLVIISLLLYYVYQSMKLSLIEDLDNELYKYSVILLVLFISYYITCNITILKSSSKFTRLILAWITLVMLTNINFIGSQSVFLIK